jgi:hypothetical protein
MNNGARAAPCGTTAHRRTPRQLIRADLCPPPPQQPIARAVQVAAAVFAAAVVLAAPSFAGDDKVKNAVCAANPTAKMCLKVRMSVSSLRPCRAWPAPSRVLQRGSITSPLM